MRNDTVGVVNGKVVRSCFMTPCFMLDGGCRGEIRQVDIYYGGNGFAANTFANTNAICEAYREYLVKNGFIIQ